MGRLVDIDDITKLFGIKDSDIYALGVIEDALYDGSLPTIELNNIQAYWLIYEIANTEEEQPIAWECSNCGEVVDTKYNYCPNCGAGMRGEQDEQEHKN